VKPEKLTIIGILFTSYLFAQDGSNIRYYEPDKLKNTLIGKYCHIDFKNRSFGGMAIDTIEIKVNSELMQFYEHREDDRHNNWFHEQYLIKVRDKNELTIKLENSKIDSITSDKIYVTSTLNHYKNDLPTDTNTVFQHSYNIQNIYTILIKK